MTVSVLVALATYDERNNLPTLVDEIRRLLPAADVLVIDDNSPDGTGDWCDEYGAQHDWFFCIHRPSKMGLGSAAWLAMQWAIERRYDALITLDADWSHPPDALPRLLEAGRDADVVIGSRYCPGGTVVGWPWSRRIISRTLNSITRRVIGAPVSDASTAYRFYRVETLAKLDFSSLRETGYAYLEELLAHLHRTGARFAESPIEFTDRRVGTSKANLAEAIGKLRVLFRLARTSRSTGCQPVASTRARKH